MTDEKGEIIKEPAIYIGQQRLEWYRSKKEALFFILHMSAKLLSELPGEWEGKVRFVWELINPETGKEEGEVTGPLRESLEDALAAIHEQVKMAGLSVYEMVYNLNELMPIHEEKGKTTIAVITDKDKSAMLEVDEGTNSFTLITNEGQVNLSGTPVEEAWRRLHTELQRYF